MRTSEWGDIMINILIFPTTLSDAVHMWLGSDIYISKEISETVVNERSISTGKIGKEQ